jgi:hypothetical protein
MSGFDEVTAHQKGNFTFAPLSDAGNRPPRVYFDVAGYVMKATPPGARIRAELEAAGKSYLKIRTRDGKHIAEVAVYEPADGNITEETIAIASAIYWSWWRAEDMYGRAPADEESKG